MYLLHDYHRLHIPPTPDRPVRMFFVLDTPDPDEQDVLTFEIEMIQGDDGPPLDVIREVLDLLFADLKVE